MQKKRIGLVGYFGNGNYGDELFLEVYRKYFYDCDLMVLEESAIYPMRTQAAYETIKTLDVIVIGGGDLFIPKYYAENYFDQQFLLKPIFYHGVGVPQWVGEDKEVIERMSDFVKHPNVRKINVRDVESASWVQEKLQPAVPVEFSADMVFALDFPRVPRRSSQKVFGLILRQITPGPTPIEWDRISALCDRARAFDYEIHNIVLGTDKTRRDDLDSLSAFDYPQAELVDPNDIAALTQAIGACDVIASTKFHGCVVATAYGIPAITMTTTDKFRNFYNLIERCDLIGHYFFPDLADRLSKYIAPIPFATRDMLRKNAKASMEMLRRQILDELA